METAGAEALSVFPSENPPRHIRISTAKKVRWDFIVCTAWWLPRCLIACLGSWVGTRQGIPWSSGCPVASSKSHSLHRWGWERLSEKAFPEEELNAIFCNSIDIVKVTAFVRMQGVDII